MSELALHAIPRPDAESAQIVQHSIARLAGYEEALTNGFYGHLFAMLPEVRALFPDDMAEQRTRLLRALLSSVQSLHDPVGMEARLQALGEVHHQRGIGEDQFQYIAHALVRTLRDLFPGEWSTWLSSAWISVFSWMIAHMTVGAQRARARGQVEPFPVPGPVPTAGPVPSGYGAALPAAVPVSAFGSRPGLPRPAPVPQISDPALAAAPATGELARWIRPVEAPAVVGRIFPRRGRRAGLV